MFDRLSDGFSSALRRLSGQANISEANIKEALDDVRTALLEADVQYDLVNEFIGRVKKDAVGHEVTKAVKPGQEFIWICNQRLTELMAPPEGVTTGVPQASPGPTVIMMCGLQGSGKTTTCGKLAAYLKKRGRSVLLVAADLQRPAAVEQLQTVAEQVRDDAPGGARVEFYGEPDKVAAYGDAVGVAVDVCQRGAQHAGAFNPGTAQQDPAPAHHGAKRQRDDVAAAQGLFDFHRGLTRAVTARVECAAAAILIPASAPAPGRDPTEYRRAFPGQPKAGSCRA